jgi:cobalt-zinc-cadmium efflux system membrane fusion protein
MQIAQGNRIVIPQSSPLRAKLLVGAVATQSVSQSLTLPAVIEANPVLAAKVLPTAPGRVIKLNVAVGDHVEQGEVVVLVKTASPTGNTDHVLALTAPATGTVTEITTAQGAFFDIPTQPLMTISRFDTVWVTAAVPESDIALISTGQPAKVALLAYPGRTFDGRVFYTSDVLDPDTRRMKLRIALSNPLGELKPGMFATVMLSSPAQIVPVVPENAVVLKDDDQAVFVEVAPWTFEVRTIQTGAEQGGEIAVEHGVKAGDRIIVSGGVLLND